MGSGYAEDEDVHNPLTRVMAPRDPEDHDTAPGGDEVVYAYEVGVTRQSVWDGLGFAGCLEPNMSRWQHGVLTATHTHTSMLSYRD